jgi:formylglycine-generating enzyme required for sulfatase activity
MMSRFCSLIGKVVSWRTLAIGAGIVAQLGLIVEPTLAQHNTPENVEALQQLSARLAREAEARQSPLYYKLLSMTTGPQGILNSDPNIKLLGVDDRGYPIYIGTCNLDAAKSISTDDVWPGGNLGLNLTGANEAGDLAQWDLHGVLYSHDEFEWFRVTNTVSSTSDHATHVAGTIVAGGVVPIAKGMSFEATLIALEADADAEAEMNQLASTGLFLSNHSYSSKVGWYQNEDAGVWYWYGDTELDPEESHGFGFYELVVGDWDEIAVLNPNYLIVKAASNDRADEGPAPGGVHYIWNPNLWNPDTEDWGDWEESNEIRPRDGGDSGFDTIPYRGNAKNALTVGAVHDIVGGYQSSNDVVMSPFSSWGPTDDGRIKPDIVANGVDVYSPIATGDDDYERMDGTSMSAPSVTGSAHLLQQQYRELHAFTPMRAATLKALIIHTADEAGLADGPDYRFGWGLMNTSTAASVIDDDAENDGRLFELSLSNEQVYSRMFESDGSEPIKVTLTWADPRGTTPERMVDPPDLMLVNDLDLRIERVSDGVEYKPWILNPTPGSEGDEATQGDNYRDNVEQVEPDEALAGLYRVSVAHKGVLADAQDFSLVVTGMIPASSSAPTVWDVFVNERVDGSGIVDISYDLEDVDSPILTVTLEASEDGGATWDFPITQVSGDIGDGISPGTGKLASWAFSDEHPGMYGTAYQVKVIAEDGSFQAPGTFVIIPAGTFIMGSPIEELGSSNVERPQHPVTLTNSFHMQTTEVTNQQYMEMAQWAYDHDYVSISNIDYLIDALDGSTQVLLRMGGVDGEFEFNEGVFTCINPDHPVKQVSWFGAARYCDWLSLQGDFDRAYEHSGGWQCNGNSPYTATGYRLPTEAEWEYACRAGSTTAFSNGPILNTNCDSNLEQIGWYRCNSEWWTQPVGQKISNAWGLFDMHGNLKEWCNDWWSDTYYSTSPNIDPIGPTSGSFRMGRGGSWFAYAENCRSAIRFTYGPGSSYSKLGFRPVRRAD